MPRKIELNNEELLEILKVKDEYKNRIDEITDKGNKLVDKSLKIKEQYEALMKEQQTIITKMQREDEKAKPIFLREIAGIEMSEYEESSMIRLGKESEGDTPEQVGKVILIIADRMEEFKVGYAKRKAEKNNSGDTDQNDGNSGADTEQPAEGSESAGDTGPEQGSELGEK